MTATLLRDTEDALLDVLGYRSEASDPEASLRFYGPRGSDFDIEIDTFHFLNRLLDYEPEIDRVYQEYAEQQETDTAHLTFGPWYAAREGAEFDGPYWLGDRRVDSFTTSGNNNSLLDHEVTFSIWEHDGKELVIVKRGAYDNGRVFSPRQGADDLLDFSFAVIYCSQCNLAWTNRFHGYRFEQDDTPLYPPSDALTQRRNELPRFLEDIETLAVDLLVHPDEWDDRKHDPDVDIKAAWPPEYPKFPGEGMDPLFPEEIEAQKEAFDPRAYYELFGFLVVDEEGNGYCPCCGGKLEAGPF